MGSGRQEAPTSNDEPKFQSTLPHGERRRLLNRISRKLEFQSTLPHGERLNFEAITLLQNYFNPRPPHGERHFRISSFCIRIHISIHAPRMGSDISLSILYPRKPYFNPRPPHGERPAYTSCHKALLSYFNPRPPHGERLFVIMKAVKQFSISIHAPRMGSDQQVSHFKLAVSNFNPRPPHGERPHRALSASR